MWNPPHFPDGLRTVCLYVHASFVVISQTSLWMILRHEFVVRILKFKKMSSDSSATGDSRIHQFGLHRTVDARTQEFLRLSRRRQIKQGCICATVSTAVTVVVVITILLIYEYVIAVELNLVQRKHENNRTDAYNFSNDSPVADKLDSTDFGFDQASFEKMPLLVNAMQENHYIDPTLDNSVLLNRKSKRLDLYNNADVYITKPIRRTSPHPFVFEYKTPSPLPFGKNKNISSRNWLENYRNIQRLKNLEQVIRYLEHTMNAKFGDLYGVPSNTQSVYIKPEASERNQEIFKATTYSPRLSKETITAIKALSDHTRESDPLFTFKPINPADINLLADGSLKSAPIHTSISYNDRRTSKQPMFKPIPNIQRGCLGIICSPVQSKIEKNIFKIINEESNADKGLINTPDKSQSYNVMHDLLTRELKRQKYIPNIYPDSIYITKATPKLQFRQKSLYRTDKPKINYHMRYKRPRVLSEKETNKEVATTNIDATKKLVNVVEPNTEPTIFGTEITSHVNKYPKNRFIFSCTNSDNCTLGIGTKEVKNNIVNQSNVILTTMKPFISIYKNVEDYYLGSSNNVHTYVSSTEPVSVLLPIYTQFKPIVKVSTEPPTWSTNPPEILKFSHEDAKINDEYQNEQYREPHGLSTTPDYFTFFKEHYKGDNVEVSTLLTKLKNEIDSQKIHDTAPKKDINLLTTTVRTFVPQINGHSRNVYDWLNEESNAENRRHLELRSFSDHRKHYVEIERKSEKFSLSDSK